MITGEVIHSLTGSNFTNYYYNAILIPDGVVATINGTVLPVMTAPIIIPVGLSNQSSASGDVFLIGNKKFGATLVLTLSYPFDFNICANS